MKNRSNSIKYFGKTIAHNKSKIELYQYKDEGVKEWGSVT